MVNEKKNYINPDDIRDETLINRKYVDTEINKVKFGDSGKKIVWTNSTPDDPVSWNVKYRFAKEGHTEVENPIAFLPTDIWDKFKAGSPLYAHFTYSANFPQIEIHNGWWGTMWSGDVSEGSPNIKRNSDGTLTLKIILDAHKDDVLISELDEKGLLFTGGDYNLLDLYCGAADALVYEEKEQSLTNKTIKPELNSLETIIHVQDDLPTIGIKRVIYHLSNPSAESHYDRGFYYFLEDEGWVKLAITDDIPDVSDVTLTDSQQSVSDDILNKLLKSRKIGIILNNYTYMNSSVTDTSLVYVNMTSDYIRTIVIDRASKNITKSQKSILGDGASMVPDLANIQEVTVPASEGTVTAPDNGYYCMFADINSGIGAVELRVGTSEGTVDVQHLSTRCLTATGGGVRTFVPVKKDDIVTVQYWNQSSVKLVFIPAVK